eukprot:7379038-Prymnesium_polylepis.1
MLFIPGDAPDKAWLLVKGSVVLKDTSGLTSGAQVAPHSADGGQPGGRMRMEHGGGPAGGR